MKKGSGSMEKYSRRSLGNIQSMIQSKTGLDFAVDGQLTGHKTRQAALLAGCLMCFALLCAFGYAKFSDLNGDEAGFASAYQGGGRFEIVVVNDSDRELKLQDKVRVMQWSTGGEVEGDSEKIRMSGLAIEPHSEGIVSIDIAEGYDVEAMKENLQDGDWYYFLLTNNDFVFGQDWMCSFDFEKEAAADVKHRLAGAMEQSAQGQKQDAAEQEYDTGSLIYGDWNWPTVSTEVSAFYGEQENGTHSDHINIAGSAGEEVYAVADGTVVETAFDSAYGNTVVLDLGDGIVVKYGHLEEIKVSAGDEVEQREVIATLGQTGMAAGPNLSFAVTVDGEEADPLAAKF